jgi:hypothetical protein
MKNVDFGAFHKPLIVFIVFLPLLMLLLGGYLQDSQSHKCFADTLMLAGGVGFSIEGMLMFLYFIAI